MSAVLSPCGRYRYTLARDWGDGPRVTFIGVNPSTADALVDDATVRKWRGFAQRWGFGGFKAVNLFAYRATDVRELAAAEDPVGPRNDLYIKTVVADSALIVPCWGSITKLPDRLCHRIGIVRDYLYAGDAELKCLGKTKHGDPRHPLMLGYATQLESWP